MIVKTLEVRDRLTFIPVVAVNMNPDNEEERYFLRRTGYPCNGQPIILMTPMRGGEKAFCGNTEWGDRTYSTAHRYIQEHWHELEDGDVIDVEFILGETAVKKESERLRDV